MYNTLATSPNLYRIISTFHPRIIAGAPKNQMDWGYTEKSGAKSGSVFADVFKDTKTVEVTGLGVGTKIVYAYVDSGEGTARKIFTHRRPSHRQRRLRPPWRPQHFQSGH